MTLLNTSTPRVLSIAGTHPTAGAGAPRGRLDPARVR